MELSPEKRRRILDAAMEEFAKHDYKHASTDTIAAKAGISKGLLFYYFKNKLSLYLCCYRCAASLVMKEAKRLETEGARDFFEILEQGAQAKLMLVRQAPYLLDFSMRVWYSDNEAVSGALHKLLGKDTDAIYHRFFHAVDRSKFKEGVDPAYVLKMLTWMTDGYLNERRRNGQPLDVEAMMTEFHKWAKQFRSMVYKEEYL